MFASTLISLILKIEIQLYTTYNMNYPKSKVTSVLDSAIIFDEWKINVAQNYFFSTSLLNQWQPRAIALTSRRLKFSISQIPNNQIVDRKLLSKCKIKYFSREHYHKQAFTFGRLKTRFGKAMCFYNIPHVNWCIVLFFFCFIRISSTSMKFSR